MSYCRKGPESDLYVWSDGDHWFIQADSLKELDRLLRALDAEGVKVPHSAFERLRSEIAQEASTAPKSSEANQLQEPS